MITSLLMTISETIYMYPKKVQSSHIPHLAFVARPSSQQWFAGTLPTDFIAHI